jgi:hypothetical protein
MFSVKNYKQAAFCYCIAIVILFFQYISYVVAPSRQEIEVGLSSTSHAAFIENRKLADHTLAYLPEVSLHTKTPRSGWLPLWTNSNELGRPLYQMWGFSSTYLPTLVFSKLLSDPWRIITALSLGFSALAGFFIMLYSREIGLNPLAGLVAGISLAASPFLMYWLITPMFAAVWCWSAGALWAVTRLHKRHDFLAWGVLAFSVYSLLMAAYPQPVVFHAYLLGVYGLWLLYTRQQAGAREAFNFFLLAASAVLFGAMLAFPVYYDLAMMAVDSARIAPKPSFFTEVLPTFTNLTEVLHFLVMGTVPEIVGNPIAPSYPYSYEGLSVTLVVLFFATAALLTSFKKTVGWWLAVALLFALTFSHSLYTVGVKYLGFNLSQNTPLSSIMLPLTVICAFGVDALSKMVERRNVIVLISTAVTLLFIAMGVALGFARNDTLRWGVVAGMLLVAILLMAQCHRHRPLLLMIALAAVLNISAYPLMLKQDRSEIAMTSPLVEKIRTNLASGSRYAAMDYEVSALPPNFNALLGLASVHTYNSLSSTRYHTLVKALGGEVMMYGRWNSVISPDFSSPVFWMSNIGLILSSNKIAHGNLESLGQQSGVHLYRVVSRMGESLQVAVPQGSIATTAVFLDDPRTLTQGTPVKTQDSGDVLQFNVPLSVPSIFVLSQKFHSDWHASAYTQGAWQEVPTVEINGVFQGVILPAAAKQVRLEFKPLVRFAWIAHLAWLVLLIVGAFKVIRSR